MLSSFLFPSPFANYFARLIVTLVYRKLRNSHGLGRIRNKLSTQYREFLIAACRTLTHDMTQVSPVVILHLGYRLEHPIILQQLPQ